MVESTSHTNKVNKNKPLKGRKPNSRQIQYQVTPPLTAIEFGGESPYLDVLSRARELSQDIMVFAFPDSGQPICSKVKKIELRHPSSTNASTTKIATPRQILKTETSRKENPSVVLLNENPYNVNKVHITFTC